jgi:hypothetical protein
LNITLTGGSRGIDQSFFKLSHFFRCWCDRRSDPRKQLRRSTGNQAVKALILATKYLKQDGIAVFMMPQFADVTINEKVKTAIKLIIESSKVS